MEIKEAIQVLKDHNIWRRGEDEELKMTDPKKLGIAIDTVVNEFENLFISGVSDLLLTEQMIIKESENRQIEGADPHSWQGGARWAMRILTKQ